MGSSEKFCLKWNDFQKNVTKSFSQLRQETGLFDVTLVSSDQLRVSAHRLVLSACSDFFKTIFHSSTHAHPLLYLDGVDSRGINLMLDYIYQGEVQIYQENLDRFLEIVKKFNLGGSVTEEYDEAKFETNFVDNKKQREELPVNVSKEEKNSTQLIHTMNQISPISEYQCTHCDYSTTHKGTLKRHKKSIHEGVKHACIQCDYQANRQDNLTQHIQTKHEGVKYACTQCDYRANRQDNLTQHIQSKHEGAKYACTQCDYQANRQDNLTRHIQSKHE